MLKQRLTKSIAFAATVALLAGCAPTPDTAKPVESAAPSAATPATTAPSAATPATTAPSVATPATTVPSAATPATTAPSAAVSAAPVVSSSTAPDKVTGGTSDIKELATFNGKVFDTSGVPVDDATVTAKSVDPAVTWAGEPQKTQSGAYVFRNAPVGARLEITARKDGWTTRLRTEVLKSNLTGDPKSNVFDFGSGNGANGTDPNNLYSIQDEPEVTMLKINGKTGSDSDAASTGNQDGSVAAAATNASRTPDKLNASSTGISSDSLTVEMTFSEPVRRDDVENYFRITSQANFNNRTSNFTIDRNLGVTNFTWAADDSSVTFKTNKAVLSNNNGDEAKYMVDFTNAFRDKTDKASKARRTFRFSPSKINDFHVFSVKNQDADPFITGFQAYDGGSSNDTVKITFSKSMDVINQTVPQALLADPTDPTKTSSQLYSYNTGTATNANNVTVLGYMEEAWVASAAGVTPVVKARAQVFRPVYTIGRLKSADIQSATAAKSGASLFLQPLSGITNTAEPALGNRGGFSLAKVDGNVITLEFTSSAFDKDDRVIINSGALVTGKYDDKINNVLNVPLEPTVTVKAFVKVTDPSGRTLDTGNSSTSANIYISNSQKVATAN